MKQINNFLGEERFPGQNLAKGMVGSGCLVIFVGLILFLGFSLLFGKAHFIFPIGVILLGTAAFLIGDFLRLVLDPESANDG